MIGEMMRRHCQKDAVDQLYTWKVNAIAVLLTVVVFGIGCYLFGSQW
jgi:hypothetical protein